MRARALAAGAALLAGLGLAGAAGATPIPPLNLAVDGCDQYDVARLRALVSIEMGTIAARRTPRESTAAVRLSCVGERATIEVEGGATTEPSRVELDLAATAPATRLRLLALTITELVSLSWTAETAAAPSTPAVQPPATATEGVVGRPAPPQPAPRKFSLFVETSARRMARPATWLGGVDVGLQRAVGDVAAIVVDLRVETGEASASATRVQWRQLALTSALAVGARRGRWAAHILPGWSVGYAFLSGKPDAANATGEVMTAIWTGPSLGLRARVGIGDAGFIALTAGSGFVTRRIVGLVDHLTPIFEVRGAWALAAASVGFDF